MMEAVMRTIIFTMSIALAGCDAPTKLEKPKEPTIAERMVSDLSRAYRSAGIPFVRCKHAQHSGVDYIGCRYDGEDSGAMLWYIDAPFVRGANGDAMSMVSRLDEKWIVEAPRPAPPEIDIAAGLRVTK